MGIRTRCPSATAAMFSTTVCLATSVIRFVTAGLLADDILLAVAGCAQYRGEAHGDGVIGPVGTSVMAEGLSSELEQR